MNLPGCMAVLMTWILAGCAGTPTSAGPELITTPLVSAAGDAARGKRLIVAREANCILCHAIPDTGERFMGDLAPPLSGVGIRLSTAELRTRIVDPMRYNPDTIMPAYYRTEGLQRVASAFSGKPVLDGQQIEDVVAYLSILK